MALEPLPPLYTSRAEMEELFSRLGVDSRIDDDQSASVNTPYDFTRAEDQPNEETYLDFIILNATELINQYLYLYYDPLVLTDNRWTRMVCTWIACYLLSKRRGNPELFTTEYEQYIETLKLIAKGPGVNGNPLVPRAALRFDLRPSHSNIVIDDHYTQSKIRVQETTSSGERAPDVHPDFYVFPE